ncbi:hypothetical protein BH18ACT12_BH18ACT12_08950 [soil metagenome]
MPDAVSITNHDELASASELDAVEAMWRTAGGQGLESAAGRRAWRGLAAAVGAERAAWLARTFAPVTGSGGEIMITRPSETRTEMRAPHVMGLPPTLEIWIARGGQSPTQAAKLTLLAAEIDLDLDDPSSTKQPWWTSFPEAVRVGLAAEIDLGTQAPNDIDAVYVVGIGGGDPGPLLAAQADSGRLGIVQPGSPTSSVNGEAALSLGGVDEWRRLVPLGPTAQPGTAAVSTALAGAPVLRGVVGGESDHRPLNRALVGTLWPALWGHSLANVWGYATQADELGLWAADNLVPEGPLPSLRIENQPYGVLPAASLRRWQAAADDPGIEARLVPLVRGLLDTCAAAAERQAGQGQTGGLRDLVRNPMAARYTWRWMVPTTLAHGLSFRFNQPVPAADLDAWWTRRARQTPSLDPAATPARQLVSVGWSHDIDVGLVEPADPPTGTTTGRGLSRLAAASVRELLAVGPVESGPRTAPPWGTSLLTELARHSLLASSAAVARRVAAQPRSVVEPVSADVRTPTETETWAARLQPPDLARRGEPEVRIRRNVIDGLKALATQDVADIDRGLRAALETATRRLDPWATAIAWRRLQTLAAAPRTLGAYGWVDAPRPQTAGNHRFILAPSTEHAAVAAVLRDRAVHDPDADRWRMNLTSDAIRGALRLADATREGSHPAESLGQMVEAIVNRPDVIDRLRDAFPTIQVFLRSDFRVRRVCNGAAVLEAAETRPDDLRQLGVLAAQVTALQELEAAVDALADLHVAEAVFGVIKGRTANVASATTAAGGQAPPPAFDVVRTPRSGRVVNTVAVVVLPNAAAPGGARPSPAALADPAVAKYLDARSGSASSPVWTWTTLDDAGEPLGTVTLANIGLRPCDTVGLGTANLRDVVREVSGSAGVGPADPPGHGIVRALAAALAGVPALAEDVGAEPDPADAAAVELEGRYETVRNAAVAAAAEARAAAAQTSTESERRKALARIARWGITPLAGEAGDPTVGGLDDRLRLAAEVLERRVGEAPAALTGSSVSVIASSLGALVAPERPLPVFARLPAASFTGVRGEPATGGPAPRIDPDWLETVAPVRPTLARLEAAQIEQRLRTFGQPLRAWSNRPGDPWQTVPPPQSDTDVVRASRLVAAFGPPNVLPPRPNANTAGTVAVGVIDRFGETIPHAEQISSVAFSHDLPPARAQQAVLLAVPPVVDEELTPAVLVDIVADVRSLTRARMADTTAMGAATGSLHLAALPATGRAGVQLGTP